MNEAKVSENRVFGIRLTPEQERGIRELAEREGLTASALVRQMIIKRLRAEAEEDRRND